MDRSQAHDSAWPGIAVETARSWRSARAIRRTLLPPVVPMTAHLRGRLSVVDRWAERPVTRFERKGTAAGRGIADLRYRRTACPTGRSADRVGQPPPAMLTSHEVPNRSTHIPNSSPHGWVASSTVTVPPSDSACQ